MRFIPDQAPGPCIFFRPDWAEPAQPVPESPNRPGGTSPPTSTHSPHQKSESGSVAVHPGSSIKIESSTNEYLAGPGPLLLRSLCLESSGVESSEHCVSAFRFEFCHFYSCYCPVFLVGLGLLTGGKVAAAESEATSTWQQEYLGSSEWPPRRTILAQYPIADNSLFSATEKDISDRTTTRLENPVPEAATPPGHAPLAVCLLFNPPIIALLHSSLLTPPSFLL